MLKVLCLNPYHGGSHQAFLAGWQAHSRHQFETWTLPPYKWKWRMRHAAVTFAQRLRPSPPQATWDVLLCTDMLNLAEFRGLWPAALARLPTVVYFHENQLTYPHRQTDQRDLHFAFTNMTSALAATAVWFNSAFHRDDFLDALEALLRRMPDYRPLDVVQEIRRKSAIHPPGIERGAAREPRRPGPLRILWAARWEHDKDPRTFFAALRHIREGGTVFRLRVLGQRFGETPSCFREAASEFRDQIDHWGYLPERSEYLRVLGESDVVVSTAQHEFFGIAVLEAVAAGCLPLVPRRLAYPEIFGGSADCFHDGTVIGLARRLAELSEKLATSSVASLDRQSLDDLCHRYDWQQAAGRMDDALALVVEHSP